MPRLFFAACAIAVSLWATDGPKISLEDLPEAVQKAIQTQTSSATLISVVQMIGDEKRYKAVTLLDGKRHDVIFGAKGELIGTHDEADLNTVPGPAKAAIEKQAANAVLLRVEKITEGQQVSYGATLRSPDGNAFEIRVALDGAVKQK